MWKSWKRRALAENKTDYSKYRFSWQEYLLCFFKAFFATGAFTGMFYRSWLGMLAFPAVWKVLYGRDKKNRIQKRKERLSLQFKDTILMVTAGIQAGSSIENAFLDVEREIGVLYGQNSEMGQELALIRKGLTNRVALDASGFWQAQRHRRNPGFYRGVCNSAASGRQLKGDDSENGRPDGTADGNAAGYCDDAGVEKI